MKNFRDMEWWKWVRTLLELIGLVLLITAVVMAANAFFGAAVKAEEYETGYAICMPNDYVNVRPYPSTRNEPIGWLDPGDEVLLDGRRKNGYVHCICMSNEAGEGWVFAGYIVADKPEMLDCEATVDSNGRLAARKYVNGKRTRWLKPGATLKVYWRSDEWCATNCGYVQTQYLEMEDSKHEDTAFENPIQK